MITHDYPWLPIVFEPTPSVDSGVTVAATNNGDGSLTQTITCPADTDLARYSLTGMFGNTQTFSCLLKTIISVTSDISHVFKTLTCNNPIIFYFSVSSNSAGSITCSKETGKYEPKFLARCSKTEPLTSGKGSQLLSLVSYLPSVVFLGELFTLATCHLSNLSVVLLGELFTLATCHLSNLSVVLLGELFTVTLASCSPW